MSQRFTNTKGQQIGRILLHQRDVNDDAPIPGGDTIISDELGAKYEDEYQYTISKIWKMIKKRLSSPPCSYC